MCPSQVRAGQVTRCLATAQSQTGCASTGPGCSVYWYTARALSQVCHVSPLGSCSQAATLLADINHPGSQEDIVSNWEPAHSVVEDAGLWGRDCPLPSISDCSTPASASSGVWEGPVCSRLALLWYSLNPLFCEQARMRVGLEPFMGKFSLFFPLWLSHSSGCC